MVDNPAFTAFYRDIEARIAAAKAAAVKKGKPLLIFFGETHNGDPVQLMMESVLLKSAYDQGARTYFDEGGEKFLSMVRMKAFQDRDQDRDQNGDYILPMAEAGLGMQVKPAEDDSKVKAELPGIGVTPESIRGREAVMIQSLLKNNGDAMMITGDGHLEAFTESKELRKKFHVVSFLASENATIEGDPHDRSPMARLKRERDTYNVTSGRVTRMDLPKGAEEMPMRSMFKSLLGDKFAGFETALHLGPPGSASGSLSLLPRLMGPPQASESELAMLEKISPRFANDYLRGITSDDLAVSSGKLTLGRLAMACSNQPGICELLLHVRPGEALAKGDMNIETLEHLSGDQMQALIGTADSGEMMEAYRKIVAAKEKDKGGPPDIPRARPPLGISR